MANATNSDKTGVSCYDGAGTFNGRTITAGTGISISNGNGVSGNPTISADADVATTYTADSGSATPAANNLNVLGTAGISTSGAGSTLTITGSDAIPLTFTADSGSATPASNNLNVIGSGGITTSGSGDTLTIDGSGAGTGAWVLIESQTAASDATLDFTTGISSTYDVYVFTFTGVVPATNNVDFWCRYSTDGGSNYLNSTSQYLWVAYGRQNAGGLGGSGGTGTSASQQIVLNAGSLGGAGIGNGGANGVSGEFWLFAPSASGTATPSTHKIQFRTNSGSWAVVDGGNSMNSSGEAVNAVRFLFSSGNISKGTITLYGIKKT